MYIIDPRISLIIGVIILGIFKLYKYVTRNNEYFKKLGIKYFKPYFLLGNTPGLLLKKYSLCEYVIHFYEMLPNEKIFGLFDLLSPVIFLRDPDVIKKIAIKDFDYFENHRSFINDTNDKLFGNSLLFLRGRKWRDMRATLSPAFTGSRMRQMFQLVSECATQTIDHFLRQATLNETNNMEFNMKEIFSRYTNDVIASCAFGIKIDSFENRTNEFYMTGRLTGNFRNFFGIMKSLLIRIFPKIARLFDIQLLDKTVRNFFSSLVISNINERIKRGIFRPDMINILMQIRCNNYDGLQLNENDRNDEIIDSYATVTESNIGREIVKRKWNDDEIVAQGFVFYIAGFDTTSTVLTFISYELAINPYVQRRLYDEIYQTNIKHNGEAIDYDGLQKMIYMDMVITETLRMWPVAPVVDRQCVKDYLFEYDGMKSFRIRKGDVVWIPIFPIHRDDKYFPNANKFDPERFSVENRNTIISGTYMPFGVGPRNCIGSRFALMGIKIILYNLLLNFSIEPNASTQIPLRLGKTPMSIGTEKPVNLTFKRR